MTFGFGLKKRIETAGWAKLSLAAIAAIALLPSGCTSMSSTCESFNHCASECCTDNLFCAWRDHVWAKRAYYSRYPVCNHLHPSHFRRGFMAGYSAVCAGEDTYLPAVPPKDYWGYEYQTADGNQMVGAWFSGYPEGVSAASADGAGMYRDVQVSSMINAALQPATDVWAPYSSSEAGGQPPVLSGQGLDMPPLPESSIEPIPANGTPLGSNRAGTTMKSMGSDETASADIPLSAQRKPLSWGLIR